MSTTYDIKRHEVDEADVQAEAMLIQLEKAEARCKKDSIFGQTYRDLKWAMKHGTEPEKAEHLFREFLDKYCPVNKALIKKRLESNKESTFDFAPDHSKPILPQDNSGRASLELLEWAEETKDEEVVNYITNYLLREKGSEEVEAQTERDLRWFLKGKGLLDSVRQGEKLKQKQPSLLKQIIRRYPIINHQVTLSEIVKEFEQSLVSGRPRAAIRQSMRRAVDRGYFEIIDTAGDTTYQRREPRYKQSYMEDLNDN